MDTAETASRKVKQMGRQIESSFGNFKNMMSQISLVGDAKHFQEGKAKFEELREKLDSKSDKSKLDAMKTLVAMMTLGRDVSELFPAVVKNVVVESMEIKKLVYMYVIHYAATNPQLALLSISSFQKDMASPNPLVRAKALHAMSCLRVAAVSHLIILQLKNAIKDSSPYVRRTAAHVLPAVHSGDTKFKDDLVNMVSVLLGDDNVFVLAGALYAFNQICPDRFDLLHGNYRKICHLLADMDEYGQIIALQALLRYCRNQFTSPFVSDNKHGDDGDKKEATSSADEEDEEDEKNKDDDLLDTLGDDEDEVELDPDHRLLLASCRNLVYSMNAQVVLSVVMLLYYCAPKNECLDAVHALTQFVNNSKREVCYVVLANISTMAAERSDLFASFYKEFYIKAIEAGFIKELKLDILSRITTEGNITAILHEFESYAKDPDIKFRCSTIEAMGRCCSMIPDVCEKTMSLLMSLLSPQNQSPEVVASSVIVIRQIIQRNPSNYEKSMLKLLKLLHKTNVPAARCAIVWIVGEYRQYISDYVPDVLRILAKKFIHEANEVKMQILNLAVKVYLADPKKVILLFKYILDLCKYDSNYDLRDRARLVRCVFFQKKKKKTASNADEPAIDAEVQRKLRTKMQEMFLSEKKLPEIVSPFQDRDRFLMNTLSHMVLHSAGDYMPLEDFPETAPDTAEKRNVKDASNPFYSSGTGFGSEKGAKSGKSSGFFGVEEEDDVQFYTSSSGTEDESGDTDSSSDDDSDDDSGDESSDDSDDDSEASDESGDDSESESEDESQHEVKVKKSAPKTSKPAAAKQKTKTKEVIESDDDEEEDEDEDNNGSSSDLEIADVIVTAAKPVEDKQTKKDKDKEKQKAEKSKKTKVKTMATVSDSDEADSEEEDEEAVLAVSKQETSDDGKKKRKSKTEKAKTQPETAPAQMNILEDLFGDMDSKTTAAPNPPGANAFDMLAIGGGDATAASTQKPSKKEKKKTKVAKRDSSDDERADDGHESGWSDSDDAGSQKKQKTTAADNVDDEKNPSQSADNKSKDNQRAAELNELFSSVIGNTMEVNAPSDIMSGDIWSGASVESMMKSQQEYVGFTGELLNHTHTQGLQINYEFVRQPSRYGVRFNQIRLIFENKWDQQMRGISLCPHGLDKSQQGYHDIHDGNIAVLEPGERKKDWVHVQFGKTSEMRFDINVEHGTNKKRYTAKIKGIPGELMRPNSSYTVDDFVRAKKSGGAMSERNLNCEVDTLNEAAKNVLNAFNIGIVNSGGVKHNFDAAKQRYYAGYLLADDSDVLIALELVNKKIVCNIHCTEFMLIDAITEVARQCLSGSK